MGGKVVFLYSHGGLKYSPIRTETVWLRYAVSGYMENADGDKNRKKDKENMKQKNRWMGMVLCGVVLLTSSCGAKAGSAPSLAAASASVSSAAAVEPEAESAEQQSAARSQAAEDQPASEAAPAASAVPAASAESASLETQPAAASASASSAAAAEPEAESAEQQSAAHSQAAEDQPASEAAPAAPTAPMEPASLEAARKYVGKDVAKLYAAIGEPRGSEYVSSCLGDGEDGILYYDGFTVTTYRENGKETVEDAY